MADLGFVRMSGSYRKDVAPFLHAPKSFLAVGTDTGIAESHCSIRVAILGDDR